MECSNNCVNSGQITMYKQFYDYPEAFKEECVIKKYFLFLMQNVCCGYSKNRLNEIVLLSTQNKC